MKIKTYSSLKPFNSAHECKNRYTDKAPKAAIQSIKNIERIPIQGLMEVINKEELVKS